MKRLQIYIDEDLDAALAVRARREGRSKAFLIRQAVRQQIDAVPDWDPLDDLVGMIDDSAGSIDDVLYGPLSESGRPRQ